MTLLARFRRRNRDRLRGAILGRETQQPRRFLAYDNHAPGSPARSGGERHPTHLKRHTRLRPELCKWHRKIGTRSTDRRVRRKGLLRARCPVSALLRTDPSLGRGARRRSRTRAIGLQERQPEARCREKALRDSRTLRPGGRWRSASRDEELSREVASGSILRSHRGQKRLTSGSPRANVDAQLGPDRVGGPRVASALQESRASLLKKGSTFSGGVGSVRSETMTRAATESVIARMTAFTGPV